MRHFSMAVVVGTDKHCAASRKALQIESAASEIQCVKNTHAENFAITNKSMNERRSAAMSSLHIGGDAGDHATSRSCF